MNRSDEAAKEIFIRFGGSHYQMLREGEYENYKSLGVSEATEREWAIESIGQSFDEFKSNSDDDSSLDRMSRLIRHIKDAGAFKNMLLMMGRDKSKFDTFKKIRVVEEVLDIGESFTNSPGLIGLATDVAREILQAAIAEPIRVSESQRSKGYLADVLTDDALKQRIRGLMDRLDRPGE